MSKNGRMTAVVAADGEAFDQGGLEPFGRSIDGGAQARWSGPIDAWRPWERRYSSNGAFINRSTVDIAL